MRDILRFFLPSRRSDRYSYLSSLPLHRLTWLLLGIFCLFGMLGFLIDILGLGHKQFLVASVWTVFTGLIAIFYITVFTRAPRLFFLPMLVHWAGSRVVGRLMHGFPEFTGPPDEGGIRSAAYATIAMSLFSFFCFLQFIRTEGRRAVRMQTELSLAHGIQQTLVPPVVHEAPQASLYGISIPSAEVGGDLVDLARLADGSLFAYVADISGHGLPAGILMGMVKTAVRTQLFDLPGPAELFDRLNVVLPAVKEPSLYATCAALRIYPADEGARVLVDYAIAAHPALLRVTSDGTVYRLGDEQLPLGLLPCGPYRSHRVLAMPGDLLAVTTDGILEAENAQGEEFGIARLEQLLTSFLTRPLDEIAARIHAAVKSFARQSDDQTLLLIRIR